MNEERIQKAINFATEIHKGQYRKDGKEYITHPIAVSKIVLENLSSLTSEDYKEILVVSSAYHDAFEDCQDKINFNLLVDFLVSIGYMGLEAHKIATIVQKLTRVSKSQCIFNYLDGIKESDEAILVKLADLQHNMSDLAPGNLLDKYKLCKWYLEN